ncbi:MAG: type 1 glutamine amidotransferase-like domain-containing protein [Lachnospiraceae bacterium]|nr:type 1 glutamine amidotransferase-like domain-containing protein [Lachnospiraceae bacterium]
MINILLEGYDIDADWLYDELKKYIRPTDLVAIVAFSFRDDRVQSEADWNLLYSKENGKYYDGFVSAFASYGIPERNISIVNYFADTQESAKQKIENADIIYFLGGLPDKMMERIREFDLCDSLMRHKGVIMGYSAGAVIQFSEYYLSPEEDYPEFRYYDGLPYLDHFYIQVHYEETEAQNDAIRRVLTERGKDVYAIMRGAGALLVENGKIKQIGNVKRIRPIK